MYKILGVLVFSSGGDPFWIVVQVWLSPSYQWKCSGFIVRRTGYPKSMISRQSYLQTLLALLTRQLRWHLNTHPLYIGDLGTLNMLYVEDLSGSSVHHHHWSNIQDGSPTTDGALKKETPMSKVFPMLTNHPYCQVVQVRISQGCHIADNYKNSSFLKLQIKLQSSG